MYKQISKIESSGVIKAGIIVGGKTKLNLNKELFTIEGNNQIPAYINTNTKDTNLNVDLNGKVVDNMTITNFNSTISNIQQIKSYLIDSSNANFTQTLTSSGTTDISGTANLSGTTNVSKEYYQGNLIDNYFMFTHDEDSALNLSTIPQFSKYLCVLVYNSEYTTGNRFDYLAKDESGTLSLFPKYITSTTLILHDQSITTLDSEKYGYQYDQGEIKYSYYQKIADNISEMQTQIQNINKSVEQLNTNVSSLQTNVSDIQADYLKSTDIYNSLDSTSASLALSAAQGKVLNDLISQMKESYVVNLGNAQTIYLNNLSSGLYYFTGGAKFYTQNESQYKWPTCDIQNITFPITWVKNSDGVCNGYTIDGAGIVVVNGVNDGFIVCKDIKKESFFKKGTTNPLSAPNNITYENVIKFDSYNLMKCGYPVIERGSGQFGEGQYFVTIRNDYDYDWIFMWDL